MQNFQKNSRGLYKKFPSPGKIFLENFGVFFKKSALSCSIQLFKIFGEKNRTFKPSIFCVENFEKLKVFDRSVGKKKILLRISEKMKQL